MSEPTTPAPELLARLVDRPWKRTLMGGAAWLLFFALGLWFMETWLGPFESVGSSTEAWLLSHVHRILLTGDHRVAALTSGIPNTTYNALYPCWVSSSYRVLAWLLPEMPSLQRLAHLLAAMAGLFGALALSAVWRGRGHAAAASALLAALFPPFVATAAMARYDSTAIALVISEIWLLTAIMRRSEAGAPDLSLLPAWAGAGVLAGLAHHAREFMLAPALAALVSTWIVVAFTRRHRAVHALVPVLVSLLGLLLGLLLLPALLGLSPLEGLRALLSSGAGTRSSQVHQQGLAGILYLKPLFWPLLVGFAGLMVAFGRASWAERRAMVPLLGALSSYLVFMLSRQQSSQYYLLAHLLVLSGVAGLVTTLPRVWMRWLLVVGMASAWVPWSLGQAPALMARTRVLFPFHRFHSEAWSAPPAQVESIVDHVLDDWPELPIIVSSWQIENLDAVALIRHDRPLTTLFPDAVSMISELALYFPGSPLLFLQVEGPARGMVDIPGAMRVDEGTTEHLQWRLLMLAPKAIPSSTQEPAPDGGVFRGAIAQSTWLKGSSDGMAEALVAWAGRQPRGAQWQLWQVVPWRPSWRAPGSGAPAQDP